MHPNISPPNDPYAKTQRRAINGSVSFVTSQWVKDSPALRRPALAVTYTAPGTPPPPPLTYPAQLGAVPRVWWVSPWGNDEANSGHADSPFASPAKALFEAWPGDLIYLTTGVYPGGGPSHVARSPAPRMLSGCLIPLLLRKLYGQRRHGFPSCVVVQLAWSYSTACPLSTFRSSYNPTSCRAPSCPQAPSTSSGPASPCSPRPATGPSSRCPWTTHRTPSTSSPCA